MNGATAQGFTIVELLVGLTIAAILLSLGIPGMSAYLQNAKVGSVTQSLHASLAYARTEAIRRNAPVEFVATNDDVSASGIANSVTGNAVGANWIVRAPQPSASNVFELLEARTGREGQATPGAASVVVDTTPSAGTFDGTIVFNGFGGTASGVAYTFDIRNPVAGACVTASGPVRCRRVRLSAGGQVRTCDPAVSDTRDTRFCTGS